MNDDLLNAYRKEPDPEFAERLYERINRPVVVVARLRQPFLLARWKPVLAGILAIAVGTFALTVPSVRAAAQDFLDLFRVKKFAAVSIDKDRISQLRDGNVSLQSLIGDSVEELKVPAEPHFVATAEEAANETGSTVLTPTYVYNMNDAPTIRVTDSAAMRFTANGEKLRSIVELLGIEDAEIPEGLDGAKVSVRIPQAVVMEYRRGGERWFATVTQAQSPEVELPPGVDIAALGELGLRITGLSADEARQFSRSVDWRTTFIVPVPASVGTFREVEVRGIAGLLITVDQERNDGKKTDPKAPRPRTILMWSEGGMVYAIASVMEPIDVVQMANSMR